jgi:hypothetical protein
MHVGSTSIRLLEQTNVSILNIDDRIVQLGLTQGTVHVHLRRPLEGSVFEIAAPHGAVLLTEPGIYRINVDPSGRTTTVRVRNGVAEVLTGEARFVVRTEQQVAFPGQRAIEAAASMDEFDRWAEGRDQKRERIAAVRYVPSEMTGYEDLDEHGSWRTLPTYGAVWVPSRVAAGWAPFSDGHWVWVSPWGWTWVDNAPWGFAPAHYGRWIWVDRYWAWSPGPVAVRPVYAPAVVAFIGGSNFSISIGARAAPAVAWVPLGWREPYIPWYRVSPTYVRNVNVAYVRDINVTNIYNITNRNTTITNIRYVNRDAPSAVTVTSRDVFVSARRVEPLKVSAQIVRSAPVISAAPITAPERTSFAQSNRGSKPLPTVTTREVVAATPPPPRERGERTSANKDDRGAAVATKGEEHPRVRVISRDSTQPATPGDAKQQTGRAKGPERGEKSAQPQKGLERDQKSTPHQAGRGKGLDREEKSSQSQAKSQQERREKAPAQEAQRPDSLPPPAAGGQRPTGKADRESERERGKKKSEREAD